MTSSSSGGVGPEPGQAVAATPLPLLPPQSWEQLRRRWRDPAAQRAAREAFCRGQTSFVIGLLPEDALALPLPEALALLQGRHGGAVAAALSPEATDPEQPRPELAPPSPVAHQPDGRWLRRANVVGINVRTVGNLGNVIKYALTLPRCQDAVHLLPVWEPGVADSLYGICSWEINPELFSPELAALCPHLDSAARQLRALVNVLHASGRTVGMDVIPHTDRYSEMALCYPAYFEWLRRQELTIVDHRERLHEEVEAAIIAFLEQEGPATADEPLPQDARALFDDATPERHRQRLLFGRPEDPAGRERRRIALVQHLYQRGYEPVPATMAPPYRGLEVDPDPAALTVDEHGMVWRDYRISAPQAMSRVFGPLARYKLYRRLEDNARWQIDFARPRQQVWDYVCDAYAAMQRRFGFDFMRGDMSHVQMRPGGVPPVADEHYDLLRAVKLRVQRQGAPYFAYFAESFLAAKDLMGYGDELDHLELSEAELVLGNLQSMAVDDDAFLPELRRYLDLAAGRAVVPCFTVITADKDDPRFDRYYLAGNELRLFFALFVPELPSYMSLGYEVRDLHPEPAPNEHYSKLYVFHETKGPKATKGPYRWGRNGELFSRLSAIRLAADRLAPRLQGRASRWLLPPDPSRIERLLAWTQSGPAPELLFVANTSQQVARQVSVPRQGCLPARLHLELSTAAAVDLTEEPAANRDQLRLPPLEPGECRIYRLLSLCSTLAVFVRP